MRCESGQDHQEICMELCHMCICITPVRKVVRFMLGLPYPRVPNRGVGVELELELKLTLKSDPCPI